MVLPIFILGQDCWDILSKTDWRGRFWGEGLANTWLCAVMKPVLQTHLPRSLWSDPALARLPGIQPLDWDNWLQVDDAFSGQMALRDQMIAENRDKVLMLDPMAQDAASELLDHVISALLSNPDYVISKCNVKRPDGVTVAIDRSDPLATAGQLIQEDLCLMQKIGDEHVLSGAVLCFPAGWTLAEKFMRPLIGIHDPVPSYDTNIARRVQRMFDAIRVEQPLWRANVLFYEYPTLFAPHFEHAPRPTTDNDAAFVRSERQSLLRLENSQAVVFSIHTYVVRRVDLSEQQVSSIAKLAENG